MLRVIVAENLIIPSPGKLRDKLLTLGLFKRKGRVPPGERRVVRFYNNQPDRIELPRGLLPEVLKITPCQVEDRRLLLPQIDFGWRGELRPEQMIATRAIVRAGGGLVIGMPGAGKTNCGLGLVAVLRQPALWLTHTKDLARQALERAKSLYNLPATAYGYIGESQESVGTHLTIAMIQSFVKNPQLAERYAKRFGSIIVDEAHHTPAMSIALVVSQLPAYYRAGLTATPERTDGLGPLARAILGQEMAIIDPMALLAHGRILLPTVRIVPTWFQYVGRADWASLQLARAADGRRNQQICDTVHREARAGRRVILLTELVKHARYLAAVLTKRFGIPAVAVAGDMPPKERQRIFAQVAQGRLVLIATKLADEGLDLPSLDCLILAAPGRSAPRLQQQVGRVMRSFHGKHSAVVYDFADVGVESLREQAEERLRVYQTLGLRVERASQHSSR